MSSRLLRTSFAALLVVLCVAIVLGGRSMPPIVAAHFAIDGHADGAMPRAAYVGLMLFVGVALPLLIVVPTALLCRHAPWSVNLPHRAHWLAPERIDATIDSLNDRFVVFGALLAVFIGAMHGLVVAAHRQSPPQLSMVSFWALLGTFVVLSIVWTVSLMRRFARPA